MPSSDEDILQSSMLSHFQQRIRSLAPRWNQRSQFLLRNATRTKPAPSSRPQSLSRPKTGFISILSDKQQPRQHMTQRQNPSFPSSAINLATPPPTEQQSARDPTRHSTMVASQVLKWQQSPSPVGCEEKSLCRTDVNPPTQHHRPGDHCPISHDITSHPLSPTMRHPTAHHTDVPTATSRRTEPTSELPWNEEEDVLLKHLMMNTQLQIMAIHKKYFHHRSQQSMMERWKSFDLTHKNEALNPDSSESTATYALSRSLECQIDTDLGVDQKPAEPEALTHPNTLQRQGIAVEVSMTSPHTLQIKQRELEDLPSTRPSLFTQPSDSMSMTKGHEMHSPETCDAGTICDSTSPTRILQLTETCVVTEDQEPTYFPQDQSSTRDSGPMNDDDSDLSAEAFSGQPQIRKPSATASLGGPRVASALTETVLMVDGASEDSEDELCVSLPAATASRSHLRREFKLQLSEVKLDSRLAAK